MGIAFRQILTWRKISTNNVAKIRKFFVFSHNKIKLKKNNLKTNINH